MIVPQFWAESRAQKRERNRQVTIRRFGWSDVSQEDAQRLADERARVALEDALAGKKLTRREPKIPYNGADGVPIREEIVSRHGEAVITRNSYGARCLNIPDVLFADIDVPTGPGARFVISSLVIFVVIAIGVAMTLPKPIAIGVDIALFIFSYPISNLAFGVIQKLRGGNEKIAVARVESFSKSHPAWNMRMYKTPKGLRVLVTHKTFQPDDKEVSECFESLGVDPVYRRMCLNQKCFRARLSAKPWRIGIEKHMRPRPGTWPVAEDKLPMRNAWIDAYERKAQQYAACRFVKAIGSGAVDPHVHSVQSLHDDMSGALSTRELA